MPSVIVEGEDSKLYQNAAKLYVLERQRPGAKSYYVFNGRVKISSRQDGLYAISNDSIHKL